MCVYRHAYRHTSGMVPQVGSLSCNDGYNVWRLSIRLPLDIREQVKPSPQIFFFWPLVCVSISGDFWRPKNVDFWRPKNVESAHRHAHAYMHPQGILISPHARESSRALTCAHACSSVLAHICGMLARGSCVPTRAHACSHMHTGVGGATR